ncbi:MAG: ATP-binding protein [Deltaproteobacteria bacterium]|nr:ATP-binding protein [Deltaproteobacteria bacterium]MCL5792703.1 ATP-binding protein [Deltaproteobacteria bacterium]
MTDILPSGNQHNSLSSTGFNEQRELLNRLYWSIWIRLFIITLIIGTALILYEHASIFRIIPWLSPLIILVISAYLFSLIEFFILKKESTLKRVALLTLIFDVMLTSAIVILTSGVDSIYAFLYLFVAIEGGFLLSKKGGLIFASASAIMYGLIVDFQYYRLIPSAIMPFQTIHSVKEIIVNLITYILTTFLIGILGAYLGDNLIKAKKELSISATDLRKLSKIHSIIINSIDSGLVTLDEGYKIKTTNPAAERITGYTLTEIYDMQVNKMMPEFKPQNTVIRAETFINKKNGEIIPVGYNISKLNDETGKVVGTVITFQDLTEMKKLEAKLKRADILATAGKLATSVAHEIRNPLASMSGSAQLLLEDTNIKNSRESSQLMQLIYREIDRINGLVTEFLNMSKPVSNITNNVSVKPIIDESWESITKRADFNPLIKLHLLVSEDSTIRADSTKLKQVFYNLFLNSVSAIKKEGNINVEFAVKDNCTVLSIKDDGEGMDYKELKMALEPFWTTMPGGTGLGLPVVQSIIEQHSGTIKITSEKGKGTVVTMSLPLN